MNEVLHEWIHAGAIHQLVRTPPLRFNDVELRWTIDRINWHHRDEPEYIATACATEISLLKTALKEARQEAHEWMEQAQEKK